MTQNEVNAMVSSADATIKSMRESGATAEQLYEASKHLETLPGYRGERVMRKSEADLMLGGGDFQRNTPLREAANMCLLAAGQLQAETRQKS